MKNCEKSHSYVKQAFSLNLPVTFSFIFNILYNALLVKHKAKLNCPRQSCIYLGNTKGTSLLVIIAVISKFRNYDSHRLYLMDCFYRKLKITCSNTEVINRGF